jgi:hypothetical protein
VDPLETLKNAGFSLSGLRVWKYFGVWKREGRGLSGRRRPFARGDQIRRRKLLQVFGYIGPAPESGQRLIFKMRKSGGDEWAGKARSSAIKEEPHAEGFGALNGHEAHLALDVVAVCEQGHLRFVGDGVLLEAVDARLYHAAESRADFNAVGEGAFGEHGVNPPGSMA